MESKNDMIVIGVDLVDVDSFIEWLCSIGAKWPDESDLSTGGNDFDEIVEDEQTRWIVWDDGTVYFEDRELVRGARVCMTVDEFKSAIELAK